MEPHLIYKGENTMSKADESIGILRRGQLATRTWLEAEAAGHSMRWQVTKARDCLAFHRGRTREQKQETRNETEVSRESFRGVKDL